MNIRPMAHNEEMSPGNAFTLLVAIGIGLLGVMLTLTGCAAGAQTAGSSGSTGDAAGEPAQALPFSKNSTIFEILPMESESRFLIDEILHGEDKRVVGKTGEVSGQIGIDFADPSTAAAGPIQVNARTLETDSAFRNRAVQNRILLAGIYEFVTFTPTAVKGLPEEIVMGEVVDLEIEGDLTITAYSKPVTFSVTVTPVSESRLEGSAATSIMRDDFDLVVPSATGVAAVAEEVVLELDFAAEAVE